MFFAKSTCHTLTIEIEKAKTLRGIAASLVGIHDTYAGSCTCFIHSFFLYSDNSCTTLSAPDQFFPGSVRRCLDERARRRPQVVVKLMMTKEMVVQSLALLMQAP